MRSTRLPSSIEKLLGFTPRPLPPHVFFLSGTALVYASFEALPEGRRRLVAFQRAPLPPGLFTPGPLTGAARDRAVLDNALATLAASFPAPVHEASLVVPDAWMRVTFTGGGDLPDNPRQRDEAVRFKLKKLVPFRVDELRIADLEIDDRLVLGFALDSLLSQVEEVFEGAGIRLGQIVNASFALLAAVDPAPDEVVALALVEEEGYALAFVHGEEPLLHRYKALTEAQPGGGSGAAGELVRRDLQLTHNFMQRQLGDRRLDRVVLVSPPEREPRWLDWLQEGLEAPAEAVSAGKLPLEPASLPSPAPAWSVLAPMLGAAMREVS